jgi:hypothetical protein
MKVIALIDDAHVIERILKHLGIWALGVAIFAPPG